MVSCSDHMMDCGAVRQDGMFRLSPPHFGHNGYVTADLSCSPEHDYLVLRRYMSSSHEVA